MTVQLNQRAQSLCAWAVQRAPALRIASHKTNLGTLILDFGIEAMGGLEAGKLLARICMSDLAIPSLHPANPAMGPWPQLAVECDDPVQACMASQYAGWPVQQDTFFAMGSGPMRAKRGKEHVLTHLKIQDSSSVAVGVLECDRLPDDSVCEMVAAECGIAPNQLSLCVAPTRSLAGTIQVVARAIETSLHKLFELGLDLHTIVSAHGTAPLPPPAREFVQGIGRTNDAILYGGHVTLWLQTDDAVLQEIGPKVPSCASRDFGVPFAKTFKKYDYDFYKVDPGLFSPAMITLVNLKSGNSYRYGAIQPEVLRQSFGELDLLGQSDIAHS
jgi:methenyltetrahydromethanopterin cyclohydrolase